MMGKGYMFIVGVMIIGLIVLTGCISIQTESQKHSICLTDCLDKGYENGGWAGFNYCHCYNASITVTVNYYQNTTNETMVFNVTNQTFNIVHNHQYYLS